MELTLVTTEDGSVSCRDNQVGELYHNRAGAYTEALRNYFEPSGAASLLQSKGSLRLMDVCFGLGYNTWVLLEELLSEPGCSGNVQVLAIEKDSRIVSCTQAVLSAGRLARVRNCLSGMSPEDLMREKVELISGQLRITLELVMDDLRTVMPTLDGECDIIFHDPFSPTKMPELWTVDLFQHYRRLLAGHGRVLTYSAAAAVRGGFLEAGFHVYRTQAVGGKSGGTLAARLPIARQFPIIDDVYSQEAVKINSASGIPYRDPGLSTRRAEILAARSAEQARLRACSDQLI